MDTPATPLLASLSIIRYPKRYTFFALLAMAIHRLPLWTNSKISFWKLLGCGKNGGFSKKPDWQQWAIFTVRESSLFTDTQPVNMKTLYGNFIAGWYSFFKCDTHTFILEPIAGHGTWDHKHAFGNIPAKMESEGRIAVLTRATININKLRRFWAHVDDTSALLQKTEGFEYSVSIGEIPFLKQATFSIWKNTESMKAFAYNTMHADIIQKTRAEKWYSEEMFVRFRIVGESGDGYKFTTERYSL